MARFLLVAGFVYLVGKSVSSFSPGSIFGILEDIGFLALLVPAAYYSYRFVVWLKNKVLWKVRNRILISFTFVALFPLLVLGLIVGVSDDCQRLGRFDPEDLAWVLFESGSILE
jgi:hypothetical protein